MRKKITNLEVYERAKVEGRYIVDNNVTIRQTAKVMCSSKSTVHRDLTKVLEYYHDPLAIEVRRVLDENQSQSYIRGGEATKRKFLQMKNSK